MANPDGTYDESDRRHAAPGHMPLPGTKFEVVAYLQGDDLVLLVNKGFCVYRALLLGAATAPEYDTDTHDTFVIRKLGSIPDQIAAALKRLPNTGMTAVGAAALRLDEGKP